MKRCSGCKTEKPFSEYHKRSSAKDGLSFHCKSCKSAKDLAYREKNRESLTLAKKEYYQKNKERHNEKSRLDYLNNSGAYKLRAKKWKKQNRDRHNANCMERHVLKMQRKPKWDQEFTDFVFLKLTTWQSAKNCLTVS